MEPATSNPEDVRLLSRARTSLEEMVLYHNCNHPKLDRSCSCCDAKVLLRELEDREQAAGGLIK